MSFDPRTRSRTPWLLIAGLVFIGYGFGCMLLIAVNG